MKHLKKNLLPHTALVVAAVAVEVAVVVIPVVVTADVATLNPHRADVAVAADATNCFVNEKLIKTRVKSPGFFIFKLNL